MTEIPVPVQPNPRRGSDIWRVLLAVTTGFTLPTCACYGLVIVMALAVRLAAGGLSGTPGNIGGGYGPAVAIVHVEGVIVSGDSEPFNAGTVAASRTVIEHIESAAANKDVKAIVLMVDSPGGSAYAADEIYHALKKVNKPIVVLMGSTAASGGYYVSMAADWIIANPNTLTGSIGVISEYPDASELMDKIGVKFTVITSGERKDIGSPYRTMTAEERAYLQKLVDEVYDGFVEIVAEGRKMTPEQVRPLADGSVYTGRQALKLSLIDQLGYREDAIAKAAKLGGISGEPRIIDYKDSPSFYEMLLSSNRPPAIMQQFADLLLNHLSHPSLAMRWVMP